MGGGTVKILSLRPIRKYFPCCNILLLFRFILLTIGRSYKGCPKGRYVKSSSTCLHAKLIWDSTPPWVVAACCKVNEIISTTNIVKQSDLKCHHVFIVLARICLNLKNWPQINMNVTLLKFFLFSFVFWSLHKEYIRINQSLNFWLMQESKRKPPHFIAEFLRINITCLVPIMAWW